MREPHSEEAQIRRNSARELAAMRYSQALQSPGDEDVSLLENVLAQAEQDAVLTQMICQEHEEIVRENQWFSPEQARQIAREAVQNSLASEVTAISVADVVRVLEAEPAASPLTPRADQNGNWRTILGQLRERNETLPPRITTSAMQEFWQRLNIAPPRDLAARFTQIARLLAMGQQQNAAHLSAARRAESSGLARSLAAPAPKMRAAVRDDERAPDDEALNRDDLSTNDDFPTPDDAAQTGSSAPE